MFSSPSPVLAGSEEDAQTAAAAKQAKATMDAMAASLEKQRQSVRRQRAGASAAQALESSPPPSGFFVTDALIQPPQMSADCEQLSQLEVQSLADRAAKANNLSSDLVRAVMRQESNFRPCAISPVGALGLMQLMPGTAAELDVNDPLNPEENTFGGARLLRKLMDRYSGDLNRTLGAYNAGPATVDEAEGIPNFPETITYVTKILRDLASTKPH